MGLDMDKLPVIQITDLGNGWSHWHRTTDAEQLIYELYKLSKQLGKDIFNNERSR